MSKPTFWIQTDFCLSLLNNRIARQYGEIHPVASGHNQHDPGRVCRRGYRLLRNREQRRYMPYCKPTTCDKQ